MSMFCVMNIISEDGMISDKIAGGSEWHSGWFRVSLPGMP